MITVVPLRRLLEGLTDDSLKTATLVGLASIPFSVVDNWSSASETTSATAVFVACLVVGYVYSARPTESRRAGVRTGLVGSIPLVVRSGVDTYVAWSETLETTVVALVAALVTVVVTVGLVVLVGMVGAMIGDRLSERVDRVRSIGIGN